MNNDHYNRYLSSLHHHGSEVTFPQFIPEIGFEHEELAFNSYYTSVHSATNNNNPGFYRAHDNGNSNNNNEEYPFVNGGSGVYSASSSFGNRNVLPNCDAPTDLVETAPPPASAWPHFPEINYSHYSHFPNVNLWSQLYFQQNNNHSEPNVHDYRNLPPPYDTTLNDSNRSTYELDIERSSVTSPTVNQHTTVPHPSAYPNDLYAVPQSHNHSFVPVPNESQQHQLPIRPIPQQASRVNPILNATHNPTHMCPACDRCCISAGGLKRHLRFCGPARARTDKSLSINGAEETDATTFAPSFVDSQPINLSSYDNVKAVIQQPVNIETVISHKPMNFSMNNSFAENPSVSEENNNVIHSQRITVPQTVSTLPCNDKLPIQPTEEQLHEALESPTVNHHPSGRRRKCPQCPLVLPSERALVGHLITHDIRKPYECRTCGSRFSRKFHMTRHIKQRGCDGSPRNQFECEYCGKHFTRKDNMREHVKSHIGVARQRVKLPCPVPTCKKEFTGKTQLQVHLNFHTGSRPYVCTRDKCEKTFRSNAALKKHIRIHNYEKPFQCPQCDTRFGSKDILARHMSSHDLQRPIKSYICSRCGMAFIQQTQLNEHQIKEHQSSETFACTACDRIYKRRWRLQKHYKQKHSTNLKATEDVDMQPGDPLLPDKEDKKISYPFACDRCPKKFEKNQSLKAHYMTHFNEAAIECTDCSRTYIRRDCLLRHLRTKHRMSPNQALEALKQMSQDKQQSADGRLLTEQAVEVTGDVALIDLTTDVGSCSTQTASEPQDATFAMVGELIDVSILEGNIIELLSLLVDPEAMRSFGWPNYSVDMVLQSVLVKCGKEPFSQPHLSVAQRLQANTKKLFSFIVDDQTALENLFSRRPVEQVLQQVIELAKSGKNSDSAVQFPL
ncbi:hypothetical protein GHT06_019799 [Daphnia sinensis]|uniref:C2H2-type domain-containing protein n=1 Tax=Daphnia sinensis TaxID=1820382 RepID=A0AAD5KKL1_9CRUS|nr:hypothetical protein GHT06_019799 [Daphnia sinensis]